MRRLSRLQPRYEAWLEEAPHGIYAVIIADDSSSERWSCGWLSVLESAAEVADGVAAGQDLGVCSAEPLSCFFEFPVVELVDFDVECLCFAGDAAGEVFLPVFEPCIDLVELELAGWLSHWVLPVIRHGVGGFGCAVRTVRWCRGRASW